jgi:hypothetical protein
MSSTEYDVSELTGTTREGTTNNPRRGSSEKCEDGHSLMNWNLLSNMLAVLLGATAVYAVNIFPMLAIFTAFVSGLTVALSARLDMGIVREKNYDTQE